MPRRRRYDRGMRGSWAWRLADDADADTVHRLLEASDAYQARKYGLPLPTRSVETTRRSIRERRVHLLERDGEAVGMFTLGREPTFAEPLSTFPPRRNPYYLQRLAIQPAESERGSLVGVRCLRRALDLARAAGADAVRCEANPDLRSTLELFELFDFRRHGRASESSGLRRIYLQNDLEPVAPATRRLGSEASASGNGGGTSPPRGAIRPAVGKEVDG